jgi:hypothetical protein
VTTNQQQEKTLRGIALQLEPLLNSSQQSMYIHLDDTHKLCNAKYARLLGYTSPDEWATTPGNFSQTFVAMESRTALLKAHDEVMKNKNAITLRVIWKKKNGKDIQTKVIIVPLVYEKQFFSLHYISTG